MKGFFENIVSLAVIALVLAGLAGLSYNAFRDDGWVENLLGDIWELHIQYPLIAIPMSVGAIVMFSSWRSHQLSKGYKSPLPNLLLYLLMGMGAWYIGNYAVTGTL